MKNNDYITLAVELTTLDIAVLDQLGADYTDNGDTVTISSDTVTISSDTRSKLADITEHGIDGGFGGFIYYSETVKFAKDNFKDIKNSLTELYDSLGEDILEGLKNWGCLRNYGMTTWEIAEALYSGGEWETQVYNALAWYAAEETARKLTDADEVEEEDEEDDVEEYDNFPTWALPWVVYGEDDTLTDEEKQQIDNWLDGRTVESWDETISFTWSPAFGKACDCCTVRLYPAD